MTEQKPSYYAIIPANVRYDKRLTPNAKLLYGEITALCNVNGHCWAGSEYFANLYGVSKRTIRNWLGDLDNYGYINRTIKYRDGSKEVYERYIALSFESNTLGNNFPKGAEKNCLPLGNNFPKGTEKNCHNNNTLINNTINNTNNNTNKEKLANAPYFDNKELNNTFLAFIEMRSSLKNGKMTKRAISMMINKLNHYDVSIAIKMLEKSILNNWKDVYEITQGGGQVGSSQGNRGNTSTDDEEDLLSMYNKYNSDEV